MPWPKGKPPWNKGLHGWQSEEHRLHRLQAITGSKRTPEQLKRMSESHIGHIVTQETREKLRQYHLGKKHTSESKTKMSEKRKGKPTWLKGHTKTTHPSVAKMAQTKAGRKLTRPQWNTGLTKETHPGLAKMALSKNLNLAQDNPNWKGGASFLPYLPNFNRQLKQRIRQRDNYTCQYPVCERRENGAAHDIHHIDYNKHNCFENNLITLCRYHNGIVNSNRAYWQQYFMAIIENTEPKNKQLSLLDCPIEEVSK